MRNAVIRPEVEMLRTPNCNAPCNNAPCNNAPCNNLPRSAGNDLSGSPFLNQLLHPLVQRQASRLGGRRRRPLTINHNHVFLYFSRLRIDSTAPLSVACVGWVEQSDTHQSSGSLPPSGSMHFLADGLAHHISQRQTQRVLFQRLIHHGLKLPPLASARALKAASTALSTRIVMRVLPTTSACSLAKWGTSLARLARLKSYSLRIIFLLLLCRLTGRNQTNHLIVTQGVTHRQQPPHVAHS